MLWVCTTSTASSFTSVEYVRQVLGSTTTSTTTGDYAEYSQLLTAIDRASAWAEGFIGYPLGAQVYQETVPSYGTRTLQLSRTPVRAVLRFFDDTSTGSATALESTDYRLTCHDGLISRDAGWIWTVGYNQELAEYAAPGSEEEPWLIEYEAGWVGPDGTTATCGGTTSTGRTLPGDVEQAIAMKAGELYANSADVAERQVGDLRISYGNLRSEGRDDPAGILLRPYVRIE